MKSTIMAGLLLAISALALPAALAANPYPHAISAHDAKALLDEGSAVLIDVRELEEVQAGMAAPAEWYPKSTIDAKLPTFVDYLKSFGDKQKILYCRSGRRVSLVIEALAPFGIEALNMGAFQDWASAGYPVKKYTP